MAHNIPFIFRRLSPTLQVAVHGAKSASQGETLAWYRKALAHLFNRIPMKLHLLRCCQESKASAAREILTARLKDCIPRCFWAGCSTSFEYTGINVAEQVASHITSHFLSTAPEYCLWNGCLRPIENHIELSSHLFQDHGVPCKLTLLISVYFCYECFL